MPSGSFANTISISVPPDVIGNETDTPTTYVITLIGSNNEILRNVSLGYDDSKKFDSLSDVFDELIRLGVMCECIV